MQEKGLATAFGGICLAKWLIMILVWNLHPYLGLLGKLVAGLVQCVWSFYVMTMAPGPRRERLSGSGAQRDALRHLRASDHRVAVEDHLIRYGRGAGRVLSANSQHEPPRAPGPSAKRDIN